MIFLFYSVVFGLSLGEMKTEGEVATKRRRARAPPRSNAPAMGVQTENRVGEGDTLVPLSSVNGDANT